MAFIGTGNLQGPGRGGIWMAEGTDEKAWTPRGTPVPRGADPAAVGARDGGGIGAVTSEPREGTASARRIGRP